MSWSFAYTSKMGIVKDTYHRLCLTVNISPDPAEITMQDLHKISTLVAGGMRHLMFRVTSTYTDSNCNIIMNQLETYFNLLCNDPRNLTNDLFISMQAPASYIKNDMFADFVANTNNLKAHVGLFIVSELSPDGDKNSLAYHGIIDSFGELRKRVREKSADLALGVTDVFNRKSLQHLFECHGDDIRVAIPGDVVMPNLNARNVEFIHGRGTNTYLYYSADVLTSLDREHVPTLEPLLEKYIMAKNNLATLLAKVIIQYGPIMCIDASLPLDYIEEYFLFICDPFAYRTINQAPTKIKRFVVMKEDVEDLVLESEEVECRYVGHLQFQSINIWLYIYIFSYLCHSVSVEWCIGKPLSSYLFPSHHTVALASRITIILTSTIQPPYPLPPCSDDIVWTRETLHRIPKRELTHDNAILAEKIKLANAFT